MRSGTGAEVARTGLDDWRRMPRRRLATGELGDDPVSLRLRHALDNGLSLAMVYAAPDKTTRRTVWPKYLECVFTGHDDPIYVRARCELRGEDRTFRVDRIREAWVPDGPPTLSQPGKATARTGKVPRSPQKSKPSPARQPTRTAKPKSQSQRSSTPVRETQPSAVRPSSVAKSGGCILPVVAAVLVILAAAAAAALA